MHDQIQFHTSIDSNHHTNLKNGHVMPFFSYSLILSCFLSGLGHEEKTNNWKTFLRAMTNAIFNKQLAVLSSKFLLILNDILLY